MKPAISINTSKADLNMGCIQRKSAWKLKSLQCHSLSLVIVGAAEREE